MDKGKYPAAIGSNVQEVERTRSVYLWAANNRVFWSIIRCHVGSLQNRSGLKEFTEAEFGHVKISCFRDVSISFAFTRRIGKAKSQETLGLHTSGEESLVVEVTICSLSCSKCSLSSIAVIV